MRRLLVGVLFLWPLSAQTPAPGASGARVWTEDLTIPTYRLNTANPVPQFAEFTTRPFYPYPALKDFETDKPLPKAWHAVYLENEFLKVTVLPDLGGKLYSIFDKITSREVLYRNNVIKYADIGLRGAWTAGGIEWNFPEGHTFTAVSPVDFVTYQDKDGSAEVTVGDTERVQGLQWMVTIRLRPGVRAVEAEIVLRNPNEIPGRYWFWANAAIPARDDLRFVYPMRLVVPHGGTARPYPMFQRQDDSSWASMKNSESLFALDSFRDFFGAYYERADNGVVQVSDHRLLPGKKIFSWGLGAQAERDVASVTDSDGPYAEIQAGRPINQSGHLPMEPFYTELILQYWYPAERLGGAWSEANRDAVLRLNVSQEKARVWLEGTRAFDALEITLQDGAGKTLQTWKTPLFPGLPFTAAADVVGTGPFVVSVRTAAVKGAVGAEIIRFRSDAPIDGNERFAGVPAVKKATPTVFEQGQAFDVESHDAKARESWREAIRLNPSFAPPHLSLGISYYRSGELQEAESHLREALRLRPDLDDAKYYLVLVLREAPNTEGERRAILTQAAARGKWSGPAHIVLGKMALAAGDTKGAIAQFSVTPDAEARTLLAMAYRMAGNAARARVLLTQLQRDIPTDHLVLSEAALAGDAPAEYDLWRLLDRQPDAVTGLALSYAEVNRAEARKLLEKAVARAGRNADPMWHYTLGWLHEANRDAAAAVQEYRAAAQMNSDYVFPSRVKEIEILEHALTALPANSPEAGRTASYLGEALAAHHRWTEARTNWIAATQAIASDPLPAKLLAFAEKTSKDSEVALAEYGQALARDPSDARFYALRDDVLARDSASPAKRLALLEAAPAQVKEQADVATRLVPLLVAAERWKAAEDLLKQMPPAASPQGAEFRRKYELAIADGYAKTGHSADAAKAVVNSTVQASNVENPGNVPPKRCMDTAAALERLGKRDEAMQWITRAADWPKNAAEPKPKPTTEDEYHRALALARLRRFPEAQAAMEFVVHNDTGGELGRDAELTLRHWKAAGVIK